MKTRQKFDESLKDEIAHGWYYRTLSSKEIEARGVQMNNVYRWSAERFGPGPRPPKGTTPPPPLPKNGVPKEVATSKPDTSVAIELQNLSRRKIKRGPNGRYPDEVRDMVMPVLLHIPVPEVHEATGINKQTLYLWKDAAQTRIDTEQNSRALAVVPAKSIEPTKVATMRKAAILVNPETVDKLLASIRKSEGFVNLEKVVKSRAAQYRAGLIEFDEDDHRLAMSYLQLAGGSVRGARR